MSGWVRVENTMPESLKVAPLSDRAFRLWMHALCYCSRGQTDGRVPARLVLSLSPSATRRTVDELVNAHLFEPIEDGYLVHDYLDHNPSRARIREMKESAKKRTAKWRGGDDAVTRHETEDVTRNSSVTSHVRDLHGPTPTELQELFDYWRDKTGKTRAQFSPERREKLKARLKHFTPDDIRAGIDGAAINPPIVNGTKYDDLMSICRNDAQLERYIERRTVVPIRQTDKPSAGDLIRKLQEAEAGA